MREDLEQQEQLDAIKGFWSDNRKWIVPLVGAAIVAAAGYNVWNWYVQQRATKASDALVAMETALFEQNLDKAKVAYKALESDYGSTAQAALGGLRLAKAYASAGELREARAVLEQVAKNADEEFAWIARIRLAGVLLDEGSAAAALNVLSGSPPKVFEPLVSDRKGDVHAALGEKEQARAAWKLAAEGLGPRSASRELVMRKLQTIDAF